MRKTQVGEGCELVNGIIGYGCRAFYGVKAVRFFLAPHSQLKYGARLINSYLGENSTISCCEVLNSLIFPSHEQHHNNSFLCAALLQGQSNMAAGATIGSNHNSRSPDGEIVAGRGFWPGLCVSLKHNSKFAAFSILAKGDFPVELNITIPFSLVSNDVSANKLVVMPAYWFLHNMYALARNAWKYCDRDKRTNKTQLLEFDYLAPDSVNEIIDAITLLQQATGNAYLKSTKGNKKFTTDNQVEEGRRLLESRDPAVNELEILVDGFENSNRPVQLIKVTAAYHIFKDLITFYAVQQLIANSGKQHKQLEELINSIPAKPVLTTWMNIGGQLIQRAAIDKLVAQIHQGKVKSWEQVHAFYKDQAAKISCRKIPACYGCIAHRLWCSFEKSETGTGAAIPATSPCYQNLDGGRHLQFTRQGLQESVP